MPKTNTVKNNTVATAEDIKTCPVDLGPEGLAQYRILTRVLRARGTLEKDDLLAVGLASVALVAFTNSRTLAHLGEARAWLSELGLTPTSRRAVTR